MYVCVGPCLVEVHVCVHMCGRVHDSCVCVCVCMVGVYVCTHVCTCVCVCMPAGVGSATLDQNEC